jgi:hypothetical protein
MVSARLVSAYWSVWEHIVSGRSGAELEVHFRTEPTPDPPKIVSPERLPVKMRCTQSLQLSRRVRAKLFP